MRIKRFNLNLNLTGIIILIALGVLLPVMLSTAVGIVAIVMARDTGGLVTGILVISFAITAAGSALITVILTGRKARLARRQSDFLASVSHELRTPLSAIRLYTQTLQAQGISNDAEQTAQCLATILRETEWLDVMIEQVLTWRAASRDILPLNMATDSVADVVRQATERFRAMAAPDELTLTTTIDTHLDVHHDSRALHAVMLNLLTNAIKYTGSDKRIAVRVHDAEGDVVIEVEDNGVGLTPVEARRVFQPFYRARHADGSETDGIGLGLAISHCLVRQHGGTLTVKSEKGRGSTFTVRLPAAVRELA